MHVVDVWSKSRFVDFRRSLFPISRVSTVVWLSYSPINCQNSRDELFASPLRSLAVLQRIVFRELSLFSIHFDGRIIPSCWSRRHGLPFLCGHAGPNRPHERGVWQRPNALADQHSFGRIQQRLPCELSFTLIDAIDNPYITVPCADCRAFAVFEEIYTRAAHP